MYRVAIDFPNVQVFLYFGNLFGNDSIGNPPYLVRGLVMMVYKLLPERSLDQGDDPAWGFGCASMVLTWTMGQRRATPSLDALYRNIPGLHSVLVSYTTRTSDEGEDMSTNLPKPSHVAGNPSRDPSVCIKALGYESYRGPTKLQATKVVSWSYRSAEEASRSSSCVCG